MSNEANLRGQSRAWLVFGGDNKSRKVVGTNFRSKTEHLQNLKYEISQRIEPTIEPLDITNRLTRFGNC